LNLARVRAKECSDLNDWESPRGSGGSFAGILRRNMKRDAWDNLHRNIRERFISPAGSAAPLCFSGTMQWVYCSPLGALMAWLLKPLSVLPRANAQAVAFDFGIYKNPAGFTKLRTYKLAENDTFTFSSLFSDDGQLHESFAGGLGMYLQLREEGGALIFSDRGYYVQIGKWRVPLPRWFTVGSFELLHRNIDADKFQVIIRISHPLGGTLFYQRGEFSRGDIRR
jgi:hypothetical protein